MACIPQLAAGLDQHQKHHPGGAEIAQLAILVLPVRVHHRNAVGQCLAAQVVVQNHHIRAFGRCNWPVAQGATIDADDQIMVPC